MKKQMHKNYKAILFLAVAVVFAVLFVQGMDYYAGEIRRPGYRIAAAAQNALRAFLFDANLDVLILTEHLAVRQDGSGEALAACYAAALFAAPACTATALALVLKRLFLTVFRRLRGIGGEKILVFGYTDEVKRLLQSEAERGKGGSCVIHVVSAAEISETETVELLRQGVFYHWIDCMSAGEEEFAELMRRVSSRKIRKIFVMEESTIRNISLYMLLHHKDKAAKKPLFAADAVCCCLCEEPHSRTLAIRFHDAEKKAAQERELLGLFLFDLAEMRVRKSFDAHPLVSEIDPSAAASCDVHALIVGFGRMGEQTLRQCINRGVLHSESRIVIDVVDREATALKSNFASTFAPGMASMTADTIFVGGEQADGELTIRFHDINIHNEAFLRFLAESAAEMPYTYAAICLRDTDAAVHCLSSIDRYARCGSSFPVAVKLENSDYLARYLDADTESYRTAYSMGGIGSEHALRFEDIYSERTEERARAFHEMYSSVDLRSAEQLREWGAELGAPKAWESLAYYRKYSNDQLDQHTASRMAVLRAMFGDEIAVQLRSRIEKAGLRLMDNGIGTFDKTEDEMLAALEADPFLSELMRMEHRRWCYAMLLFGWSGRENMEKDEERMVTPCLYNWEKLCAGIARDKAKYDLLPLLVLCRDERENA